MSVIKIENTKSLVGIIASNEAKRPGSIALTFDRTGRDYGYADLLAAADRICDVVSGRGIGPGGHVGFRGENHWLIFPMLLAATMGRWTVVPIDPYLHRDEALRILNHAEPTLIVLENMAPGEQWGDIAILDMKVLEGEVDSALAARKSAPARSERIAAAAAGVPDAQRPLLIVYTSGTSGGMKGVVVTEASLAQAGAGLSQAAGIRSADAMICVTPCSHMNAISVTGMTTLYAGARLVLSQVLGFTNAGSYFEMVKRNGGTVLSLIPSMLNLMMRLNPKPMDMGAAGVRLAFCGAAPLPESLWRGFEQHFNIPVVQGYGLTETTTWVTCTPLGPEKDYGTTGVPVNCDIRIKKPQRGESGEVLIGGPLVFPGYWKAKTTFIDGYFPTGDLGFIDETGQLHITGRIKDIVIRNGVNILPQEIDRVMDEHPDIAESASVGVPDITVGERLISGVVLKKSADALLTSGEVRKWAARHMSNFLVPDNVVFLHALPRGRTGKVLKTALFEILSGKTGDDIIACFDNRKTKRTSLTEPSRVKAFVNRFVHRGEPVRFLKFWGVGDRNDLIEYDQMALDQLKRIMDDIARAYEPGGHLTLVLTDMHGKINSRDPEVMRAYFGDIVKESAKRGFETLYSTELLKHEGLSFEDIVTASQSDEMRKTWSECDIKEDLLKQAGKHARSGTAEDKARLYLTSCMKERLIYERLFPHHLFFTYNHPRHDAISPGLPKIYIFPVVRSNGVKPWFHPAQTEIQIAKGE